MDTIQLDKKDTELSASFFVAIFYFFIVIVQHIHSKASSKIRCLSDDFIDKSKSL